MSTSQPTGSSDMLAGTRHTDDIKGEALAECYDSSPPTAGFRRGVPKGKDKWRPVKDFANNLSLDANSAAMDDTQRFQAEPVCLA